MVIESGELGSEVNLVSAVEDWFGKTNETGR